MLQSTLLSIVALTLNIPQYRSYLYMYIAQHGVPEIWNELLGHGLYILAD